MNQPVDAVERSRPVEGEWEIDQERSLRDTPDVRARSIAVAGRLQLDDEDIDLPNQVLIAIDGILAGIGDLDRSDGEFAALIDERRLTVGHHDLELYLPTERGTIQRIQES